HLAHATPDDQVLTLKKTFRPGPESILSFASRLGWASPAQAARVQVSEDGESSWQEVWSAVGTGDHGQTDFSPQSVPLAGFANQAVNVRFVYDYTIGSYFPQPDSGVGWYIDNISITDASELLDEAIADASPGNSF